MKQKYSFEAYSPTTRPGEQSRPIAVSLADEKEFHLALESYKDRSGRLFPTCSELLEVLRSLGYEKRIWKPVDSWILDSGLSLDVGSPPPDSQPVLNWYSAIDSPVLP